MENAGFIPILMLLSPGKTLSNMVSVRSALFALHFLMSSSASTRLMVRIHGCIGSNLGGQRAKR